MSLLRSGVGWGAGAAIASTFLACSVFTSLDGLSDGADAGGVFPPDAGTAASPPDDAAPPPTDTAPGATDGGNPPTFDATTGSDAGTTKDSATDAGNDAALPKDAGGAEACVPSTLVCDGKVHACNGIVNDGCPSGISVGAAGSAQLLGGDPTGGTPFSDPCPAGQVLIGVGGATGSWIDAIYGICGSVGLQVSSSTTPYTYAVTISAGATLPLQGVVGGTDSTWQVTCGPNQAVVGVAGNAGAAMDHVVLSCAALSITGSPGAFSLSRGSVSALPPQGDSTGGSPFAPFVCPAPQTIALVSGSSGQWVDSLGVACALPSLTLVH